jgi:hypothetical protein
MVGVLMVVAIMVVAMVGMVAEEGMVEAAEDVEGMKEREWGGWRWNDTSGVSVGCKFPVTLM